METLKKLLNFESSNQNDNSSPSELASVFARAGQLWRPIGVFVIILVQRVVVGGGADADEVHRPRAAKGIPLLEEVPDFGQGRRC